MNIDAQQVTYMGQVVNDTVPGSGWVGKREGGPVSCRMSAKTRPLTLKGMFRLRSFRAMALVGISSGDGFKGNLHLIMIPTM